MLVLVLKNSSVDEGISSTHHMNFLQDLYEMCEMCCNSLHFADERNAQSTPAALSAAQLDARSFQGCCRGGLMDFDSLQVLLLSERLQAVGNVFDQCRSARFQQRQQQEAMAKRRRLSPMVLV